MIKPPDGFAEPPKKALSPYYQGYIDADKANAYFTGPANVIVNQPSPRWTPETAQHKLWWNGVMDYIRDKHARKSRRTLGTHD